MIYLVHFQILIYSAEVFSLAMSESSTPPKYFLLFILFSIPLLFFSSGLEYFSEQTPIADDGSLSRQSLLRFIDENVTDRRKLSRMSGSSKLGEGDFAVMIPDEGNILVLISGL